MTTKRANIQNDFLATIQPIVLVGGRSRRFGRDKLREPWGAGGQLLVQCPIEALRAVFGPRVKLVGECHPSILPLADGVIVDRYPGIGPIGGILSALQDWRGPVLVLAGDMPSVAPADVTCIVKAAADTPEAWAVMAMTDRRHPCVGFYATAAATELNQRHEQGRYQLSTAIPDRHIALVSLSTQAVANVNCPDDCATQR